MSRLPALLALAAWSVLLVWPTPVNAQQNQELGLPFITNFSSRDIGGVASGWALVEDNRGMILAGMASGLAEFDGESWRFEETTNRGFPRSFALGPDGAVYVGFVGDLGYLAADSLGRTTVVSMLEQVPEDKRDFDEVWHIHARSDGIYFFTANRILRWTGSRIVAIDGDFHVGRMVRDEIYVREWGVGLTKLQGDSVALVPGGEMFADERIYVMLEYDDDRMLIGTRTMGMFLYDGERFEPFRTEADRFLAENQVYLPGAVLQDGTFAIGTLAGGMLHMDRDGSIIRILDRGNGLPDNTVTFLYQARDGDLWLATNNGISRVEIESPFTVFDSRQGITAGVQAFARHDGRLYAGSISGILELDPASGSFRSPGGRSVPSLGLLPVRDALLSASMTSGVAQLRRGTLSIVKDAFGNEFVANALIRAHADTNIVFVGLRTGLGALYYSGFGRWVDLGKTPDFGEITSVAVTEDDVIWAGGTDGLFRITIPWINGRLAVDSAQVRQMGPEDGIQQGDAFVDMLGERIIAVTDEAVFEVNPQTGSLVPASDMPPARHRIISAIAQNPDGSRAYANLGRGTYLGTRNASGSYDWDPAPFRQLHEDLLTDILVDNDDVVWMGLPEGVVRYDPSAETPSIDAPFATLIRRVVVNEDSLIFAGWRDAVPRPSPVLEHDQNALTFTFAHPGTRADLTEHRTRLDGFDAQWSSWSSDATRNYTNLPAGLYTFHAESRISGGEATPEGSFSFQITPPWYLTWWAYAGYALLLGLGVFVVDRFQRRRVTQKEREQAERREMELRTEAAESDARALQAENERQKNVELLSEIGRDITSTLSIKGIIDTAYENVNALMDASVFSIGIHNEEQSRLDFPATREKGESLHPYYNELDDENRLAVHCFKNNVEVVVDDWARDYGKYVKTRAEPVAGEDPASIIYLPLLSKDRTIGVITAQSFERKAYTEYHVNVLRNLATYTAIALDNAEAYDRLNETVADLNRAMSDLSTTQEQLVTQEKMASLGQLTAGIAHEIKNPLNFVNNFAELNAELAGEVADLFEAHRRDIPDDLLDEMLPMLTSLGVNAQQIHKHGKRADSIIRNMMQHASGGHTERFPVDVNAFVDEYLNLSYHGMRAQVPGLNADIVKEFDRSAGNVSMAPQEMGRVIMNLVNNALYAVHEKAGEIDGQYEPRVTVETRRKGRSVEIVVEDNGPGIPSEIREKIFEPLFTTKPTGSGTGLGLSLSFDIVTVNHGGSLKVESEEGAGARFVITLPS